MNPFYDVNQEVTSPIFRSRVAAAAKRYLWGIGPRKQFLSRRWKRFDIIANADNTCGKSDVPTSHRQLIISACTRLVWAPRAHTNMLWMPNIGDRFQVCTSKKLH